MVTFVITKHDAHCIGFQRVMEHLSRMETFWFCQHKQFQVAKLQITWHAVWPLKPTKDILVPQCLSVYSHITIPTHNLWSNHILDIHGIVCIHIKTQDAKSEGSGENVSHLIVLHLQIWNGLKESRRQLPVADRTEPQGWVKDTSGQARESSVTAEGSPPVVVTWQSRFKIAQLYATSNTWEVVIFL